MKTISTPIYHQDPFSRKTRFTHIGPGCALAVMLAVVGLQSSASAQGIVTDDFDSGALASGPSGWQVRNVVQPLGGFVENTFPDNGAGKALRLRRGSADMAPLGQPQAYGTGRAWLFRTNDYTDFYVAMDLVNWNNDTNQALVLLARASGFDETLGPGFPPGLGTTDGYVCNYDNAQDGTGPGDRLGGQFQINLVANEGPDTLAAAEVTLTPGRSYRMVFKGVGTILTAQLYDLDDLSQPIVTIVVDDPTYASGNSGIVTFHRDDTTHPNLTDLTVDNYYSGPTDPNADIAPAIRHPLSGVPQVVTRNPTNRFKNFHPATEGISFTVNTFAADLINTAATKLYLNGTDVSTSLAPLPANATNASFTTAAGTLVANTVYSARIEVQDVTGTKRSTNTFWFDTFSDAYLETAPAKTVEVEDYNHSVGQYLLEPILVSGFDTNGLQIRGFGDGYLDLVGVESVDFHDNRTTIESDGGVSFNQYRIGDVVGTVQGPFEIEDSLHTFQPGFYDDGSINRGNDNTRRKYAVEGMREYQVMRTEAGEWLNYTRVFPDTNYHVFLRVGSFGTNSVELALVTSDPTMPEQTTSPLGTFVIPNQIMRSNYRYQQLMSDGLPAVVNLAGTNTIRLTIGGTPIKDNRTINLNYLLFAPAAAVTIPSVALQSSATVNGQYSDDLSAVLDTVNKTITVPVSGDARFYRIRSGGATTITSITRVGGNVVITYN